MRKIPKKSRLKVWNELFRVALKEHGVKLAAAFANKYTELCR